MAAIVSDHALGNAGGAGGIEDIERVGRQHRHAIGRPRGGGELVPIMVARLGMVAPGDQLGPAHRPLQDHAMLGLGAGFGDRGVEQWLVGDDAIGLDAARG